MSIVTAVIIFVPSSLLCNGYRRLFHCG